VISFFVRDRHRGGLVASFFREKISIYGWTLTNHKESDSAVEWLDTKKHRADIIPVEVLPIISEWNLGKGESQVISFAFQNSGFTAAIDDKAAKKCAAVFNVYVSGTIAIIIRAKKTGLISKAGPLFSGLRANGFRISDEIIMTALSLVGENNPK